MTISIRSAARVLPGEDIPGAELDNARLAELSAAALRWLESSGCPDVPEPCDASFPETRIGIRARRVLDASLDASDLAVAVARRVLERAGVEPREVGCVLVSSVTSPRPVPSLASRVQAELGLPEELLALDVVLGCNGFLGALELAKGVLDQPDSRSRFALVLCAEAMTRVLDASDRNTLPIFGDGAGGVLLERGAGPGLAPAYHATLGEQRERIQISDAPFDRTRPMLRIESRRGDLGLRQDLESRKRVRMAGREVFRDMTQLLPKLIRAYIERLGRRLDDFETIVFHQANRRMIEAVGKKLLGDGADARIPLHLKRFGNTTSASIPILLSELVDQGHSLTSGPKLLVGFGTGYSVGMTALGCV